MSPVLQIEYNGSAAGTEEKEAESLDFGGIFALKNPKNVLSGTGHLIRNVLTGVTVGVGSLVAFPAWGAKEDGVRGFVTGLGKGARAG
jgi:hypothetical protein